MGLIYVNREGAGSQRRNHFLPAAAIRALPLAIWTNDEGTVALIAGRHTLGKTHGAAAASHVGATSGSRAIEAQGLGWRVAAMVAALARMLSPHGRWSGRRRADPVEQLFLREPVQI